MSSERMSPELMEAIRYATLDDSTKIISYLEEKRNEQERRNKKNDRIAIATLIVASASVIIAVFSLLISLA